MFRPALPGAPAARAAHLRRPGHHGLRPAPAIVARSPARAGRCLSQRRRLHHHEHPGAGHLAELDLPVTVVVFQNRRARLVRQQQEPTVRGRYPASNFLRQPDTRGHRPGLRPQGGQWAPRPTRWAAWPRPCRHGRAPRGAVDRAEGVYPGCSPARQPRNDQEQTPCNQSLSARANHPGVRPASPTSSPPGLNLEGILCGPIGDGPGRAASSPGDRGRPPAARAERAERPARRARRDPALRLAPGLRSARVGELKMAS